MVKSSADKSGRNDLKRQNIIQLLLSLVIIVLVNIIGHYAFTRIDLTSEKRYSLSDATREILEEVDDIVFFQVYLEGDFPAGFKRLRRATKEMLDEFRAYNDNIEYEFINPFEDAEGKKKSDIIQLLMERGLQPTDLQVKTTEGSSQKIIFPAAIVTYKSQESPVQLLISQVNLPPEEILNNSIQHLEYNLASTIKKLSSPYKPPIAFIEGHGELDALETADAQQALSDYYQVDRIRIDGQLSSLTVRDSIEKDEGVGFAIRNKYDAIIIAKPDSVFPEKDKFIIDQFIMRGGKVLWLIDPVFASMDSLQNTEATMGIINNLNLDDQLFKYGVRLNTNLVMDLNALPIPMVAGRIADQPQIEFFPWYYFPLVNPAGDHPIVNDINIVKTEFISSVDTISRPGIRKTYLLQTSQYSRIVNTPAYINLNTLREAPDERLYNKGHQPVAVALEGKFESVFVNRVPPAIQNEEAIGFLEKGKQSKMVVVADGDIIKNQVRYSKGQPIPLPLGYDRYTNQEFGNREFILNSVNYLMDNTGLTNLRTRDLKLRLLDQTKVSRERLKWQLINLIIPVFLVIIYGFVHLIIRKRKYTKQ